MEKCDFCGDMVKYTCKLHIYKVCEECSISCSLNVKNVDFLFREPPVYTCGCCQKVIEEPEFAVRCNGENCKYGIRFMCNTHAKWGVKDNTWICPECAKEKEVVDLDAE